MFLKNPQLNSRKSEYYCLTNQLGIREFEERVSLWGHILHQLWNTDTVNQLQWTKPLRITLNLVDIMSSQQQASSEISTQKWELLWQPLILQLTNWKSNIGQEAGNTQLLTRLWKKTAEQLGLTRRDEITGGASDRHWFSSALSSEQHKPDCAF